MKRKDLDNRLPKNIDLGDSLNETILSEERMKEDHLLTMALYFELCLRDGSPVNISFDSLTQYINHQSRISIETGVEQDVGATGYLTWLYNR